MFTHVLLELFHIYYIEHWQFTERGHIFVKVHLAESSKVATDAKSEICPNEGPGEQMLKSGGCHFETLSGFEAADERNSWDGFKNIIKDEELRPDSSSNRKSANVSSDRVTLLVCVEDTGIGIPLQAQARVFMPFMQADSSTSRHYGGTGIGLSISKCLVELMGGQINFVSRPEVGSTFSFTAVFWKCKKNELNEKKKSISENHPSTFRGMKAVVVDGKPVRAAVTKYHLKRLGLRVDVASSIKAAVVGAKKGSVTAG